MQTIANKPRINHLNKTKATVLQTHEKYTAEHAEVASVVDLSELVQDVVETINFGFSTSRVSRKAAVDVAKSIGSKPDDDLDRVETEASEIIGDVVTLVDIDPAVDWLCKTDVGSWKRILMNVLGNALKYTSHGSLRVKLQLGSSPEHLSRDSKSSQCIRLDVLDTGRGIDPKFLEHGLFEPFMQENSLSAGTGLGLSIVQQLVHKLGGVVDVQSELNVGTSLTVLVPVGEHLQMLDRESAMSLSTRRLSNLDPDGVLKGRTLEVPVLNHTTENAINLSCTSAVRILLGEIASQWLGMNVLLRTEAVEHHKTGKHIVALPVDSKWVLFVAHGGQTITVDIEHPYSPRKLAAALVRASNWQRVASRSRAVEKAQKLSEIKKRKMDMSEDNISSSEDSDSASVLKSHPLNLPPRTMVPSDSKRRPLHLLLVDDNAINLKFLGACVQKCGCTCAIATNGEEAVEVYKSSVDRFDLIFMDISMPVMDGCTASRQIRAHETTAGWSRTQIIALTALGAEDVRQEASSSGMDDFMVKPVPMKTVRELLKKLEPELRDRNALDSKPV